MYNEILFSHKQEEILSYATMWIKLEYIMLSEVSLSLKVK